MNSLNTLYTELDFENGSLYQATEHPSVYSKDIDWIEKGEWLAAAKHAGAETIFFVDNNPVAVFATCGAGLHEKVKIFNRVWCLARPRLLFLASPCEITVYDLAQKPINEHQEEDWTKLEKLDILEDLRNVSQVLQKYHRDHVESGRVFEDERFGDLKNRADHALIRDLKSVRSQLIESGLSGSRIRFAHALIGRSIFIRYLEDRRILTKEYFLKVANQNTDWTELLNNPVNRSGFEFAEQETYYPHVLEDKEFTYALFRELARDFNGDMFPDVLAEEKEVTQEHVKLIQGLLYGDIGIQKKLFFYSYRFDIVPLDLISSIYEVFYHDSSNDLKKNNKKNQDGAFYTPSVLVEFILSRILTPAILEKKPRVLDPACGSGIFLVETFRRLVRYEWHKKKHALTFAQLKDILKTQIAGIEVNEEAARITAFSLYLAMLHYVDTPAIDQQIKRGNKLPNLVASANVSANHFHSILVANTFDIDYIQSNPLWHKRFGSGCADIIVGNPPWGAPGTNADTEVKERHQKALDWCANKHKPIGDKEFSQAFLWRVLDFLAENGKAAMLVSAGVLFKHNTTTMNFRNSWFNQVRLDEIFNFIHVRKLFFKNADAPFLSICFSKEKQQDNPVYYWSAKQTIDIDKTQSIVFSKYDRHILRSEDLSSVNIWKELWFGRKADTELLRLFQSKKQLQNFADVEKCGRGYEVVSKTSNADVLQTFKSIRINSFSRYDALEFSTSPPKVYRLGNLHLYQGTRLLVQRGILEKTSVKGCLVSRFETTPFCFTNAIHGIKLKSTEEWQYKTILGLLWSSLARYFFFMTSSTWGLWHHEIHLHDELLQLPVVLEPSNPATNKIIAIVDKLRGYNPQSKDIIHPEGIPAEEIEAQRTKWEIELDEAVFELYGLNEEEKDLINDFCTVTLPFFYSPFDSMGTFPAIKNKDLAWIIKYVYTFCRRWNLYAGEEAEMRAEVHLGAHENMIAIEFFPCDQGDSWNLQPKEDTWSYILEQIGKTLPHPMGTSQIILDGIVQVVSNAGIIIIKRNEKRFWTPSLAREDADSTICKRMLEAFPSEGLHN